MNAQEVISRLGLVPLQKEGGYFRETYRAADLVQVTLNAHNGPVSRSVSTAIYYLITSQDFSALHRTTQDEIFHFYGGDPAQLLILSASGNPEVTILGNDLTAGQSPQIIVPANTWQGIRPVHGGQFGWSLMGATVAPGFDYADFELGERAELLKLYPAAKEQIEEYTHS